MKFQIFKDDPEALAHATTFVCGFHGLGETGYIVTKELISHLPNCKRAAVIASSGAPPFISVEEGQIRMPFEIYVSGEIAVFIPRIQPYRHVQVEFSEKLSEWVKKNFKQAYLIGGLDKRLQEGDKIARFIPTRSFKDDEGHTSDLNATIDQNILDPGLFVTGPLAIVLSYLDLYKFPALGVLAYAERERPDPEGAANAIKILSQFLGFKIDIGELIENAKLIEKEINDRLELEKKHSPEDMDDNKTYT